MLLWSIQATRKNMVCKGVKDSLEDVAYHATEFRQHEIELFQTQQGWFTAGRGPRL